MRRPPAMDLQWDDKPAVTTMTRPVSGSALPPPPPRLSRPMLASDTHPALEIASELRGVSGSRTQSAWRQQLSNLSVSSVARRCRHLSAPSSRPTAQRPGTTALVRSTGRQAALCLNQLRPLSTSTRILMTPTISTALTQSLPSITPGNSGMPHKLALGFHIHIPTVHKTKRIQSIVRSLHHWRPLCCSVQSDNYSNFLRALTKLHRGCAVKFL